MDQLLLPLLLCKIYNGHPQPKALHRSPLHLPHLPHSNWLGRCQLSPLMHLPPLSSLHHPAPMSSSNSGQVITVQDPIRQMQLESLVIIMLHLHNRRCITICSLRMDKLVQVYGPRRMGSNGLVLDRASKAYPSRFLLRYTKICILCFVFLLACIFISLSCFLSFLMFFSICYLLV